MKNKIKKYIANKLRKLISEVELEKFNQTLHFFKGDTTLVSKNVIVKPFNFNNSNLEITLQGNNRINDYVLIQGSGKLYIGTNTYVGEFSVIGTNDNVTIGENVMIAQSVSIRDTDHNFADTESPMTTQGIVTERVIIEDDVWIGYGAVITKGITIGKGSIIGANAVVTKDIPPYSIAVGVPARVLKSRLNA